MIDRCHTGSTAAQFDISPLVMAVSRGTQEVRSNTKSKTWVVIWYLSNGRTA